MVIVVVTNGRAGACEGGWRGTFLSPRWRVGGDSIAPSILVIFKADPMWLVVIEYYI